MDCLGNPLEIGDYVVGSGWMNSLSILRVVGWSKKGTIKLRTLKQWERAENNPGQKVKLRYGGEVIKLDPQQVLYKVLKGQE